MGLGSTAKKIQRLADRAEDLYTELMATKETVEGSVERIEAVEDELDEQRRLLEAVAREVGVDPEEIDDVEDGER